MKFDDEKIQELLDDLHSLMWYGGGCPICAHALEDKRGKYFRYSCLLGGEINCQPRWRGLKMRKKAEAVTIAEVTEDEIRFSNGQKLWFSHDADCCEYNYADFEQIEPLALQTEFEWPITLEAVEKSGFRFGNPPGKMFFIPCYSRQNGCYSTQIDIHCGDAELELEETEHEFY